MPTPQISVDIQLDVWRHLVTLLLSFSASLLSIIGILLLLIYRALLSEARHAIARIGSIESTQRDFITAMLEMTIQLHPDKAEAITVGFRSFLMRPKERTGD